MNKMKHTNIKILSYAYQIPEGMTLDTPPSGEVDDRIIHIIKDRKQNKLFSKQDRLALLSAYNAWEKSGIKEKDADYADNTGIYFCVGTLPFADKPLEKLAKNSQVDGKLCFDAFSTTGFNSMNPMLTFQCLPNMPLFHISFNLGITGRYFMTYPGTQDLFSALGRAVDDLRSGVVKYALVGSSCDQKNILVKHHLNRTQKEFTQSAIDCSAAIVLTLSDDFSAVAEFSDISFDYAGYDPFQEKIILAKENCLPAYCGPVSSLIYLGLSLDQNITNIKYTWEGNPGLRASFSASRI